MLYEVDYWGFEFAWSATDRNQDQDVTQERASCFSVAGFEPVFHLRASAGGNAEKKDIHPK